jgi:hypothetical protein
MTSGICLNPNVKWITFNGGADFGYLLHSLSGQDLPNEESKFHTLLQTYFCNYFDIKEMKRDIDFLGGGLSKVAKELEVERIGTTHQAGSDSLITCMVFFKLVEVYRNWWKGADLEAQLDRKFNGILYGLGNSMNEDPYIEEYKSITIEHGNGKLINLNRVLTNSPFMHGHHMGDYISSASTTISNCSSINSLNGISTPNPLINQQHYMLMQSSSNGKHVQMDEDY